MSASQRRKGASAEVWRPVGVNNGMFAPFYEVSSLGRVRAATWRKGRGGKRGRVLFQAKDNKGYRQVYLHYGKCRKMTVKVHRLVADAFIGKPGPDYTVDHIDCNKDNNCLSNLEYVTRAENMRRAVANGLLPNRRPHNYHIGKKLDMDAAREIRLRVASGVPRKVIAADVGVHVMTIGEIVRGEIWAE